jgi:hypothetical protein
MINSNFLPKIFASILTFNLIAIASCIAATPIVPDLSQLASQKNWKGDVVNTQQIKKEDSPAVEFIGQGEKIVWLDNLQLESGILEFDVKGKKSPRQGSFIGVAFRVKDKKTYDVVYFRPFNFNSNNAENKAHAVQYMSEPQWPWYKLRKDKPGQYEKIITPAPDGDAWFHVKIILENRQVKVFVNNEIKPSLTVDELSNRSAGSVGLWSIGYGAIANLKITPIK